MSNSVLAWKKLLCQAFTESGIITNRAGVTSLINIRRFVYQSLQNAGIENRSPFSIWQLIKIRIQSRGVPLQVRKQCIDTVLGMHRPAPYFQSKSAHFIFVSVLLSLAILLIPKTATTFKSSKTTLSILQEKRANYADYEFATASLQLASHYQTASIPVSTAPIPQKQNGLSGISWILKQQDSSYSLQILAASSEASLQQFCSQHKICDDSAYYITQVKGKKLVRLIYGSYLNHQAAKLAKNELPDSLKALAPWARSFKQIKSEL